MWKRYLSLCLTVMSLFLLVGCLHQAKPRLEGTYQNDSFWNGTSVSFLFDRQENTYELYIDDRPVDHGSYDEYDEGRYALIGEIREFDIEIEPGNEFKVVIEKIAGETPIELVQKSQIPTRILGHFDDIEEYQELLEP